MPGVPPEHSSKLGKEGLMRRLLDRRRIGDSGCWEYTGKLDRKGYGRVRFKGVRTRFVHRIAAWLWLGFDIESDLLICHHCDNPACFNPEHLFTGTHSDNLIDAAHKGRLSSRGSGMWEAAKTHCPHGHEYTPENTYIRNGSRTCKLCRSEQSKARQQRLRELKQPKQLPTHCGNGHEYTPDNTGFAGRSRYCIACKRERTKRWIAAHRERLNETRRNRNHQKKRN